MKHQQVLTSINNNINNIISSITFHFIVELQYNSCGDISPTTTPTPKTLQDNSHRQQLCNDINY